MPYGGLVNIVEENTPEHLQESPRRMKPSLVKKESRFYSGLREKNFILNAKTEEILKKNPLKK